MKMAFKKFGFGLILLGIFIIIVQPFAGVTGAVIDISGAIGKIWFFVGLGLVVGGVVLVVAGQRLEELVEINADEILDRISAIEPNKNRVALIGDTSAFLKRSPAQVEKILKTYGENSYVPDSALYEMRYDSILKKAVENNSYDAEGFEKYSERARDYLEKTEKPRMYGILVPILDDVISGKKKIEKLTPKELQLISRNSERLKKLAERDKFDMRGLGMEGIKKTREYLEDHCKISETDVDVLATGMKMAEKKYHAIIVQKDIDFVQAIDLIKKVEPELGKNLDYVDLYPERVEKVA